MAVTQRSSARNPQTAYVSFSAEINAHTTESLIAAMANCAGKVTVRVQVRWLDLPDATFTKLREIIRDLEALDEGADSGNGSDPEGG